MWHNDSTPGDTCKRNENIYPHKNLYLDINDSIIHKSQQVEIN